MWNAEYYDENRRHVRAGLMSARRGRTELRKIDTGFTDFKDHNILERCPFSGYIVP